MAPGPYSLAVMETVAKLYYGIMFKLCYIHVYKSGCLEGQVKGLHTCFSNQGKLTM